MSTCRCGSATSDHVLSICSATGPAPAVETNPSCIDGHRRDYRAPSPLDPMQAQEEMFCDEFHLVDLRVFDNCKKVSTNVDHVFNLAADMGGMGFIQSNHSVIFYNNTMISFNMLEAARQTGVKRCALTCLLRPRGPPFCPVFLVVCRSFIMALWHVLCGCPLLRVCTINAAMQMINPQVVPKVP